MNKSIGGTPTSSAAATVAVTPTGPAVATPSLTVTIPTITTTALSSAIASTSAFSSLIPPPTPAAIPTYDQTKIEYLEEIRQLDSSINEAEKHAKTNTEKEVLLRDLRHRRRDAKQKLADLITTAEETKYNIDYAAKKVAEKQRRKAIVTATVGITGTDTLKPTGNEEEAKFNRILNMCGHYKRSINDLSEKIKERLEEDVSPMAEESIERRQLEIETKVNTLKTYVTEYKKYNTDAMAVAEAAQIQHHLNSLAEVMEVSNMLEAKLKLTDEKTKKKLALTKSEQLEGMKLQKFSGIGDKRYLNYYNFYQEFKEIVLQKQYSDSTKLKYLKQYTEKDAYDLVKNYHSGKELMIAFKTLDDHYGRADMVIRESLRNLKAIEPVKNVTDIRANRKILSIINTNISTLRCYNFDLEGSEVENSTSLIEMEEKVPHKIYIKWEQEKASLKRQDRKITIQGFINLYSDYLNIEENAQYLRRPGRSEEKDKGSPQKTQRAQIYQTKVKVNATKVVPQTKWERKPFNPARTQVRNTAKGKDVNKFGQNRYPGRETRYKQNRNTSFPKFCIFCETNTHSTSFCALKKYTAQYKEDKCRKHNACYMCFRTTEHRAETCPKKLKCFLCPKTHHFNMHPREQILAYYAKNKRNPKKQ